MGIKAKRTDLKGLQEGGEMVPSPAEPAGHPVVASKYHFLE